MGAVSSLIKKETIEMGFCDKEPNYILSLVIEEINKKNLWKIRRDLLGMNENFINKNIKKIMKCLTNILDNNTEVIISQIDYYLFKNNNLPALQILNISAKNYQKTYNVDSEKYYCVHCQIYG